MAHQVETMAYAGETPWHGLGTRVSNDLSVDEMLEQSGLDWKVRAIQDKLETDNDTEEGQSYVDSLLTAGTD